MNTQCFLSTKELDQLMDENKKEFAGIMAIPHSFSLSGILFNNLGKKDLNKLRRAKASLLKPSIPEGYYAAPVPSCEALQAKFVGLESKRVKRLANAAVAQLNDHAIAGSLTQKKG